jgi:hypothetical protein
MNTKRTKQGYRTRLYLKLVLNQLKVMRVGLFIVGVKKGKKDSMTFVGLLFANSIYLK